MLDTNTKRRIDTARDILVGKVPDPKSQVEQITIALIYKFMNDIDARRARRWAASALSSPASSTSIAGRTWFTPGWAAMKCSTCMWRR